MTKKANRKIRIITRSKNRKLFGICGGIGEYFGIDPNIIRLLWLVLTVTGGIGPGILAYIIATWILPKSENY